LDARYLFDADYLQRLKEGEAATERHFANYFDPLIRIKAIKAGPQSARAAEDIRQETLIRVIESVRQGKVEHPERLGAFVLAVCHNIVRELARGERRLTQLPDQAFDIPSGRPGVEAGLLEEERHKQMKRALGELGAKDRELLRRICLDDHDKDGICNEFGVTREYLRVLLHRARMRLRSAIGRGKGKGAS
jgi:RNA polymerase sigma-70 factor (ECF subfamily)